MNRSQTINIKLVIQLCYLDKVCKKLYEEKEEKH
jgi:hypothetical protein